MRYGNFEQLKVNEVVNRVPEARNTLREYGIDPTANRMNLAQAAAAASVTSDELLAVMEFRMRRAAQQRRTEVTRELELEMA